jgi:hypothetical protein
MTREELVDRVTAATKGTKGDPLTRDEVAQVVDATVNVLETVHGALLSDGIPVHEEPAGGEPKADGEVELPPEVEPTTEPAGPDPSQA